VFILIALTRSISGRINDRQQQLATVTTKIGRSHLLNLVVLHVVVHCPFRRELCDMVIGMTILTKQHSRTKQREYDQLR